MSNPLQISKTYSQFIQRWLDAQPQWQAWLDESSPHPLTKSALVNLFQQALPNDTWLTSSEEQFLASLRTARQKAMLWLGVRDIAGLASLQEVMQCMSDMAEIALYYAAEFAKNTLIQTYGLPQNSQGQTQSLWIIGMGKLGAQELNVSSDIDLIFLYEDEGFTLGGRKEISNHEWFILQGKKIIRYLSEFTSEGQVFRVDMRLRPNGDSGALVSNLEMLEEYFLVQGREWERYAWIKARLVYPLQEADASGLAPSLNQIVRSFVYRKYLDFGIINSIRKLHGQIRHEANLRANQYPERALDIKLGKGGIREIEFLAQMPQLIRGGQETLLRTRSTIQVLEHITHLQLMPRQMADELLSAYYFLRKLEHLLQWRSDAQVHHLPSDVAVLDQIAQRMGLGDKKAFDQQLLQHQSCVANYFAKAFALDTSSEEIPILIPSASFEQYPEFIAKLELVKASKRFELISELSKQNFDFILLYVLDHDPLVKELTLIKLLDFLEVIFRRSSYLSLLKEFPGAIHRVLRLLEQSKWASDYLMKHPHLLDELLSSPEDVATEQDMAVYWVHWQTELERKIALNLAADQDDEAVWNLLREAHHSEIFQILLADLGGFKAPQLPVEKVSDRLTSLADIVIQIALNYAWQAIQKKHHLTLPLPEAGFAVIAYGKLGGKELGYGSDLDIVFIFDETLLGSESDAILPHFFTLARKFILSITTATSSGILFEIDTRLRPNGEAGLMVTSLTTFENYQKKIGLNTAWVWEHQALTRARFCVGDPRLGVKFEAIRREVLAIPRNDQELIEEVIQMRQKLHLGHHNSTQNFDLKHDAGGMVDIEFMIQYQILKNAKNFPSLMDNIGNIALLQECANCGLINQTEASQVANAYRLFRQLQHQIRLDGVSVARIEEAQMTPEIFALRQQVKSLWARLFLKVQ